MVRMHGDRQIVGKTGRRLGSFGRLNVPVSRVLAVLLVTASILSGHVLTGSQVSYAAEPTVQNPVIFRVIGALVDGGTSLRYDVEVDGVYANQSYQSVSIVYPVELTLNTSALGTASGTVPICATSGATNCWAISHSESSDYRTSSLLWRGTTPRPASGLKNDLDALYFLLTNAGVYPPENSTVAIEAFADKITTYVDANDKVHYYLFVNEKVLNNLSGDFRLGTVPSGWLTMNGSKFTEYDSSTKPRTNINWIKAYNIAKLMTRANPKYPDEPNRDRMQGYLATVTSQAEQDKIYFDIADHCGWLGGTRLLKGNHGTTIATTTLTGTPILDDAQIGSNLTNTAAGYGGATAAGSPANTGLTARYSPITANSQATDGAINWYWADGPEAGKIFFVGPMGSGSTVTPKATNGHVPIAEAAANATVPSGFKGWEPWANWTGDNGSNVTVANPGSSTNTEPNNTGPNTATSGTGATTNTEHSLQFAYNGSGKWNDFNYANLSNAAADTAVNVIRGFYVEFGGYPNDPSVDDLNNVAIQSISTVDLVMPVQIRYRSTELINNPADPPRQYDTHRTMTDTSRPGGVGTSGTDNDRIITFEKDYQYTILRSGTPTNPLVANGFTPPEGYVYYDWEFQGNPEDLANLSSTSDTVSGFHSLHYQYITFLYRPVDVNINFSGNYPGWSSASVTPLTKTVKYDTPYGELATATRAGYTFNGWYTGGSVDNNGTPDDSTDDIQTGGTRVDAASRVAQTGAHTLYAHWTENHNYVVTYDLDGGQLGGATTIPDLTGVAWTDDGLLPNGTPTRTGNIFMGWDVVINGTQNNVSNTDSYAFLATSATEPGITLKARWRPDDRIYVMYQINGGQTQPGATLEDKDYEPGDPIVPIPGMPCPGDDGNCVEIPAPTKVGYRFHDWHITDKGFGPVNDRLNEDLSAGARSYRDLALCTAQDAAAGLCTENEVGDYLVLWAHWVSIQYQVAYDANDAVDGVSETGWTAPPRTGVTWEDNGFTPPTTGNPVRPGYVFMGWNTAADGSGVAANSGTAFSVLAAGDDQTVNPDGTENGACTWISGLDAEGKRELLDPDNPSAGYVTPSATCPGLTLYAQWQPERTFFVRYDTNGGTPATIADLTGVTMSQNHLIPATEPVRDGYMFSGWKVSYNGSKTLDPAGTDTFGDLAADPNAGFIVVQAQYSPKSRYQIQYNVNGGNSGYTPTSKGAASLPTTDPKYSEIVWTQTNLLPTVDPTKTTNQTSGSYNGTTCSTSSPCVVPTGIFLGWNTKADGSGHQVVPSDSYGDIVASLAASGLAPSCSAPANPSGATGCLTLYAMWATPNTYTVIYDLNGGASPAGSPITNQTLSAATALVPLPIPAAPTGYQFDHWFVSNNGNGMSNPAPVAANTPYSTLAYGDGTSTPYKPTITLRAVYTEKNTFALNYDWNPPAGLANANETVEPFTAYNGAAVSWTQSGFTPHQATQPGQTLLGWTLNADGSGNYVLPSTQFKDLAAIVCAATPSACSNGEPTGAITIYAQWEPASFKVQYDLNGIATPPDWDVDPNVDGNQQVRTVGFDDQQLLPNTAELQRKGYQPAGWLVSVNGATTAQVTDNDSYRTLAASGAPYITLQLQWIAKAYQVKYDDGFSDTQVWATADPTSDYANALRWTSAIPYPATPVRPGYTFKDWTLWKRGTTVVSAAPAESREPVPTGTAYNVLADYDGMDWSNITLQAAWTPKTYEVFYDLTTCPNAEAMANHTATTELTARTGVYWSDDGLLPSADPVCPGSLLDGWQVTKQGSQSVPDGPELTSATAYRALATNDDVPSLTLSPIWVDPVLISYNPVTFSNSQIAPALLTTAVGGTVTNSGDNWVAPNRDTTSSEATALPGYHFVKWCAAPTPPAVVSWNCLPLTNGLLPQTLNPTSAGSPNHAGAYLALFQEDSDVTYGYSIRAYDNTGTLLSGAAAAASGSLSSTGGAVAPASGSTSTTVTPSAGYDLVKWCTLDSFTAAAEAGDGRNCAALDEPAGASGPTLAPTRLDGLYPGGFFVVVLQESGNATITYTVATLNSDGAVDTTHVGGSVTNPGANPVPPVHGSTSSSATAATGYTFTKWCTQASFQANGSACAALTEQTSTDPVTYSPSLTPARVGGLNATETYVAIFTETGKVTISYSVAAFDAAGTRAGDSGSTLTSDAMGATLSSAGGAVAPVSGSSSSTATLQPGFEFRGWCTVENFEDDGLACAPLTAGVSGTTLTPAPQDGLLTLGAYVAVVQETATATFSYSAATFANDGTTPQASTAGGSVSNSGGTVPAVTGSSSSTASANVGYDFHGWCTAAAFAANGAACATVTIDVTLTATKTGGVLSGGSYVAVFIEREAASYTYDAWTFAHDGAAASPDTAGGYVTPTSQQVAPATGSPSSTATNHAGYHFVKWCTAEAFGATDGSGGLACPAASAELSEGGFNPTLAPSKTGNVYPGGSYVALFQEDTPVTISYSVASFTNGGAAESTSIGGTLSTATQHVAPATGTPASTATANNAFGFVKWCEGENFNSVGWACTALATVTDPDGRTLLPPKALGLNSTGSYVAVFEEAGPVTVTFTTASFDTHGVAVTDDLGGANAGGAVSPSGSHTYAPANGNPASVATANAGFSLVKWCTAEAFDATDGTGGLACAALTSEATLQPARGEDGLVKAEHYVAIFQEADHELISYGVVTFDSNDQPLATPAGGMIDNLGGEVNPATETSTSTATASAGFHFVKWCAVDSVTPAEEGGAGYNGFGVWGKDCWALTTQSTTINPDPESTDPQQFQLDPRGTNGVYSSGSYVAIFKEDPSRDITFTQASFDNTGERLADTAGGSVAPSGTVAVPPASGTPVSVATANGGYQFLKWCTLDDFNTAVDGVITGLDCAALTANTDGTQLTPPRQDGLNFEATYIAVFQEVENVELTYATATFAHDADPDDAFTPAQLGLTGGSVSPTSQSIQPVWGTAESAATANSGFSFVKWCEATDFDTARWNCTALSDVSGDAGEVLSPAKVEGLNVSGSYVALFEENAAATISYTVATFGAGPEPTQQSPDDLGGSLTNFGGSVPPASGSSSSTALPSAGYTFTGWCRLDGGDGFDTAGFGCARLSDGVVGNSLTPTASGALHLSGDYVAIFQENSAVAISFTAATWNNAGTATLSLTGGTVAPSGTQNYAPSTGEPTSTASTGAAGFEFTGWCASGGEDGYLIAGYDCARITDDATFAPAKVGGVNVPGSYVALFHELEPTTVTYAPRSFDSNGGVLSDPRGGTVTNTGGEVALASGSTSSTAQPAAGFDFVKWCALTDFNTPVVDDAITGSECTGLTVEQGANGATLTPVRGNNGLNQGGSYVAIFKEQPTVTISYSAATFDALGNAAVQRDLGGTVTPSGPQQVAPATGETSSSATANAWFDFTKWCEATDFAVNLADCTELGAAAGVSDASATGALLTPVKGENGLHVNGSAYVAVFTEHASATITFGARTFSNTGAPIAADAGGWVTNAGANTVPWATGSISSTASERPGFEFDKWCVAAEFDELAAIEGGSGLSCEPVEWSHTLTPSRTGDGLAADGSYVAVFREVGDVTYGYGVVTVNHDGIVEPEGDGGHVTNPGENPTAPVTGAPGSEAEPNDGYAFYRWCTAADWAANGMECADVSDGNPLLQPQPGEDGIYGGEAYVAIFRELEHVVLIYQATDGGSVNLPAEALNPVIGAAHGSTATPEPGYRLEGWYLTSLGGEPLDEPLLITTEPTLVPEQTGDVWVTATYLAKFVERAGVTITYEPEEGGSVTVPSETFNDQTGAPNGSTAIANDGYYFVGWYTFVAGHETQVSLSDYLLPTPGEAGWSDTTYIARFAPQCPVPGQVQNSSGECVTPPVCADGQRLTADLKGCEETPIPPTPACPPGWTLDETGSTCVPSQNPPVCPEGWQPTADGLACEIIPEPPVPPVPTCPEGWALDEAGTSCTPLVPPICPEGWQLDGSGLACEVIPPVPPTPQCPDGIEECEPAEMLCPDGWVAVVGEDGPSCVPPTPTCPEGSTVSEDGSCNPAAWQCPLGWQLTEEMTCEPTPTEPIVCPAGWAQVDNSDSCRPIPPTPQPECPDGTVLGDGGLCYPSIEPPTPQCPSGWQVSTAGVGCQPIPTPTCPDGMHLDETMTACLPDDTPPQCPAGQQLNSLGECEPIICPVGEQLNGLGVCEPVICPVGEQLNSQGECVPIVCSAGQQLNTAKDGCEPIVCPANQQLNAAGECVAKCGAGTHWDTTQNMCVADVTQCPAGQLRNTAGVCVTPPTCGTATHLDAVQLVCVADQQQNCGTGTHWDTTQNKCVADVAQCPAGQQLNAAKTGCEPIVCPAGQQLNAAQTGCEYSPCPTGQARNNAGICVTPSDSPTPCPWRPGVMIDDPTCIAPVSSGSSYAPNADLVTRYAPNVGSITTLAPSSTPSAVLNTAGSNQPTVADAPDGRRLFFTGAVLWPILIGGATLVVGTRLRQQQKRAARGKHRN